MSMESEKAAVPAPELDLDSAGPPESGSPEAGNGCASCREPLVEVYFLSSGKMICLRCAEFSRELARAARVGRFLKALAAGLGGSLVGALLYFVVLWTTGYEVGLIAILVGLIVGGSVRWGSGGRGGWLYQGMAVLMTYTAIVSTYVPLIVREASKHMEEEEARIQSASKDETPGVIARDPVSEAETPPTAWDLVVALGLLVGVLFLSPILAGFQNVIGWLIIGFALFEAWKLNRAGPGLQGPYRIGTLPGASA